MGKINEIQEQVTQSFGNNSFTTKITDTTVEFDSARDSFTFKDPVEVPSINVGGTESVPFTAEEKAKLATVTTPMQIKGRVDSVGDLPIEDVKVGDVYLVGVSGSENFEEYVCTEISGSPEAPVWECLGKAVEPQVQADWNQNNNTKADYIKNRICYEAETEVIYLENVTIDGTGSLTYYFNPPQDMLSGSYNITVGTETVSFSMSGDDLQTSGSFALSQGGGGVQWSKNGIYAAPDGEKAVINMNVNPALYAGASVKIYNTSTELVTIADKFIPNTIARMTDIPVVPTVATNILNGSATGSLRSKGTAEEESGTYTIGHYAFAEGYLSKASGTSSHAEGSSTNASSNSSHAEGYRSKASGEYAHAEGDSTNATGYSSHAEGSNTYANHRSQHSFGEYNIIDSSTQESIARGTYVEIVGNGTDRFARSNARTLDWDGNEMLAGTLTIGGTSGATIKVESGALKVSFDGGTTWLTISAS